MAHADDPHRRSDPMKPKVAIWGASSNAMVVADIIRLEDKFEIVGFLDDFQAQNGNKEFWNLPILGGVEQLDCMYRDGIERIIVGIGDCKTRLEKAELALNKGYSLAVAIHPHASIAADVSIGPGTVIKSTAVVEPGVVIKQSVIVGARVYVGHECVLDDGVHISGGGVIGGNSVFGRAAWAGLGATIKEPSAYRSWRADWSGVCGFGEHPGMA